MNPTVHLMNSAMMPNASGTYTSHPIDAEQFSVHVREASQKGVLKSYIGYPATAKIIATLTGYPIDVSREETLIASGDTLLVAKLKYRVNPGAKQTHDPTIDDFEFRLVYYKE